MKISTSQGAKLLGITRQALEYRIKKYNESVREFDTIGFYEKCRFYIEKNDLKLFKIRKPNKDRIIMNKVKKP